MNELESTPPDEAKWVTYDGSVPQDVRLLGPAVEGPLIAALAPIFAAIGIGGLLKLVFIGFSLFMFFKNRARVKERGDLEAERAFSFSLENTSEPDTPLQIIYGEHLVFPHFFYQSLSNIGNNNRIDLGLGLGEGPIESVSELKVNGIAFGNLTGSNSHNVHLGANDSAADVDTRLTKVGFTQDFQDEIPPGQSIIRAGQSNQTTELEVGIELPEGLFRVDEEKGIRSASVFLRFEYQRTDIPSQPWVFAFDKTITAKHRGTIRNSYTLARGLTPGRYQVRVKNATGDQDEFEYTDTVALDFLKEYFPHTFDVRNFAYIGMTLEATSSVQGRVPEVSCLVKGRKVRVYSSPSVYVTSWSDNPVWCLADLLTHPRYGLGYLISYGDLDLSSFVTVGDYCQQTDANDARRGQLDLNINQIKPALDWVETILNTFGGIIRFSGEKISLTVYRDEASVQSFDEGNILEGTFKVQYADPNESTNVNTIHGTIFNRENNWARDVVSVKVDEEIGSPIDVVERRVDLIGVTRPDVAESLLWKTLKSLRVNIRSIEFEADVSALNAEIGDVVSVSYKRQGWVTKKFRILEIEEPSLQTRKIRAIEHNAGVFDAEATSLLPVIQTELVNPLEPPGSIEEVDVFPFFVRNDDGSIRTDLLVSWSPVNGSFIGIDHFEVFYDEDAGTELPPGTPYNANDPNSRFFLKTDGTLVSGTRVPSSTFAGSVYPPDTSLTIQGINPNSFYDVAVVTVNQNQVRQDLENAVREYVFSEPYGEAPENTSSFTATFQDGDVVLQWTAVSLATNPDLAGYEVRTNGSFGTIDSNLVFRGNQTSFTLRNVTYRSRTFYIKTYNRSGVYSTTSRSATASNPAPGTSAMNAAVVNGKTARLSWTASGASDVIGYRLDVSTTAGFAPSNATFYKYVTGRLTVSELFTETDSTFPVRYVRVAQRDALTDRLGDYTWSPPISFQCEEEVSFFDSVSINLINDSDCNGISPGYWTGSFTQGSSTIQLPPAKTAEQVIPSAARRTATSYVRLRLNIRKTSSGATAGGLYFYLRDLNNKGGILNAWTTTDLTTSWSEKEYIIERSRLLAAGASDDWRLSFASGGSNVATIEIDKVMLHDGRDPLLWVPHSMEQITGYTNWVGTTQITENAITTGKLAANAVTADKIAAQAIRAVHLSADAISANEIQANSITADLYQELRNTLYFKFSGEVDDGHPLDVLFHLPEELLALAEGGIQQIKLSYAVKPFRATSKAGTAMAGGSSVPATLTQGPGAHSHTLRVNRTSNNITYIYSTDGNTWYRTQPSGTTGGGSGTDTFRVESADGHQHDWRVNRASVSNPPAGARVIWVTPQGALAATNGGGTITLQNANGTIGSHTHTIAVAANGTGVPTTGRVSKGTGTTGNNSETLYCYETNGIAVQTSAINGPPGYQVNIPPHTHEVQFGIYEESNSVVVGVQRSDNGFAFENTDYHSSPSTSVLNLDLNGGSFYTAGAGAGFKALRFVVTGANEGRCRLDGVIMVKADISA